MTTKTKITALALTGVACLGAAAPASAQEVPYGYTDCGWKDTVNGGWTWSPYDGAVYHLMARGMSCNMAKRKNRRLRYSNTGQIRAPQGFRCKELAGGYESSDVRCSKIGDSYWAFRFQTGA